MKQPDSTSDSASLIDQCAAVCIDRGWRLAWLMLRHREDAADAVQQAFVVALRKQHMIPTDNPWPWLAAVIAREAQYIRRKRGRSVVGPLAGETAMPLQDERTRQPLAEMIEREREELLARALDELSPEERDALLVTKLGGLTYAEASVVLGVPLGTLNHRITRALATLRRKLREDDEPALARALAALPVIGVPDDLRDAVTAAAQSFTGGIGGFIFLGGVAVKKSTALFIAMLLILLLGAGGIHLLIDTMPSEEPQNVSTQVLDDDATGTDSSAKESAETNRSVMPTEADSSDSNKSKVPSEALGDLETVPSRNRVLVVKDPDGKPVNLRLVVDWRIDTADPWATQNVTTDANGRVELDAPVEAMLRLNLEETDWILGWSNLLLKQGDAETTVTVYALKPLRIRVTYADGEPYEGLLTVKAGRLWSASLQMGKAPGRSEPVPSGWPTLARGTYEPFHETVTFAGLPSGVEFTFKTSATRPGYSEAERVVTTADVDSGEQIEIVVPEGVSRRTPGKVVLIPDEGEAIEGRCRMFKLSEDGSWDNSAWNSRNPLESGDVWAGRYVLVILGAKAWCSAEFEVHPGEITELHPEFLTAASLSARVVDEKGESVQGAVVAFATQQLPYTIRFGNTATSTPYAGEAISNGEGQLQLGDLPPGTFEFQVTADGMQPWVGHATLIAGQVCAIGDIRLETAKGRVEVRFPDWDFKARKLTWTLSDANRHTIYHGEVESSTLVLDKLPVGRTYRLQISIRVPMGARAFWFIKPFDLTLAAPTQEFDGTDKEWPPDLD